MAGNRSARRRGRVLPALLCAGCAFGGAARAADTTTEVWPEADLFYRLAPRTRLYLALPYSASAESGAQSWSFEGYLDASIRPILRKYLQTEDWQRSRFLWMRVGYARVGKATDGERQTPEDRAVVALYGKAHLPAEIWLEGRARADFRWINGEYSNRWRLRLEATREFTVRERPVAPYLNVEWFYDTRYDRWARTLAQAGTEITVNEHFRYEIYLAHQIDHAPSEAKVNALGLTAKWYY